MVSASKWSRWRRHSLFYHCYFRKLITSDNKMYFLHLQSWNIGLEEAKEYRKRSKYFILLVFNCLLFLIHLQPIINKNKVIPILGDQPLFLSVLSSHPTSKLTNSPPHAANHTNTSLSLLPSRPAPLTPTIKMDLATLFEHTVQNHPDLKNWIVLFNIIPTAIFLGVILVAAVINFGVAITIQGEKLYSIEFYG